MEPRGTRTVFLFALALGAMLATGRPALAQDASEQLPPVQGPVDQPEASPQLVDRIVAVVDREPILLSDLEREIDNYRFEAETYGTPIPDDPAELRRDVLDRLIEVKLLVAQAKVDGFVIGSEELEGETGRALQEIIDRYGTRAALEQDLRASGMTFDDLQARTRERVRNRLYTLRMIQAHVRPQVEVLDNEVKQFYESNLDQVPRKPSEVTLANILVVPQPKPEVQQRLVARLSEIRQVLDGGTTFDEAARRFSDGPNAERGGLVGSFRRGDLFSPVLEEVAWRLPVGQVSEPVNTELGVHLVQVTQRTEEQVTLRQILLRVEINDEDRAEARARAEEIVRQARAGQDFAELARKYSDDPSSRESGGLLGTFPLPQLSAQFAKAIEGLSPGGVSDPLEGAAGLFVLKLVDRADGDVYSFDEIRPRIRAMLEDQKTQTKLQEFLQELRDRFYIEVKV